MSEDYKFLGEAKPGLSEHYTRAEGENSDPFECQRADGGVMRLVAEPLLVIVGLGPTTELN